MPHRGPVARLSWGHRTLRAVRSMPHFSRKCSVGDSVINWFNQFVHALHVNLPTRGCPVAAWGASSLGIGSPGTRCMLLRAIPCAVNANSARNTSIHHEASGHDAECSERELAVNGRWPRRGGHRSLARILAAVALSSGGVTRCAAAACRQHQRPEQTDQSRCERAMSSHDGFFLSSKD